MPLTQSFQFKAAFYGERAKGEVGLIVTGGISPNSAGKGVFGAAKLSSESERSMHEVVTGEVHRHGGKIAMQVLHTGRYGKIHLTNKFINCHTRILQKRSIHVIFYEHSPSHK
jgi:2,4-dienoyl-CoA reductase-like NADH-dependent reductase (Old Yellow Enzyme family)